MPASRWVVAGLLLLHLAGCGGGGAASGGVASSSSSASSVAPAATDSPFWAQWAASLQYAVAAQSLNTTLADIVYDPFVAQEQAESGGSLVTHYPATLVDAGDFCTMTKSGTYVRCSPAGSWASGAACGPNTWDRMVWNVARFNWQASQAVKVWEFASDWKPLPDGQGLNAWEPLFHPVLSNGVLYVSGAGRTVWRVNRTSGAALSQLDPFAGTGEVTDLSSSTPTVLPDGAILHGAISQYNGFRGHLLKFSAVYSHQGTYSIVIKDNRYDTPGLYCTRSDPICAPLPPGLFCIMQLDANLNREWQFQNTTVDAAEPNGYEWCINAPAIDLNGVVHVNGEDGYLYAIAQGNSGVFSAPRQRRFLKQAIGAAYTPLSIGADGRLYTQNAGRLYVIGN